jgi:hypothetical protein
MNVGADPINPRRSGKEMLERLQRQCPHLTREEILAIAASAGFDLLDLQANPKNEGAAE